MTTAPRDYHEAVFRRLLSKAFPGSNSTKGGQEILVDCIFHLGDNGKNLSINPKKALYKCWVCGARGGVRKLLSYMRDQKIITDIDLHAVFTGGGLSVALLEKKEDEELPSDVGYDEKYPCVYPEGAVPLSEEHTRARGYLTSRGLEERDIRALRLALGVKHGSRYFGRIFFPIFDKTGTQMRHWVARTIIDDTPKVLNAGKYFTAYPSSRCLFGEHTIEEGRPLAVCEGVFDACSVRKHIMPAVALLGKEAHSYHVVAISKKKPSVIFVCLDGGEDKAAAKLAERFNMICPTVVVRLPKGMDPNEVELDVLENSFEAAKALTLAHS